MSPLITSKYILQYPGIWLSEHLCSKLLEWITYKPINKTGWILCPNWGFDLINSKRCCCVASVVSNSVRPHRQQPTRLPCPWDSPGKNTGVQPNIFVFVGRFSRVRLFATLWTVARQAPLSILFSPGRNTGVGCHALLQGIFLNQGMNPNLPHLLRCRQILYPLSYPGRPVEAGSPPKPQPLSQAG